MYQKTLKKGFSLEGIGLHTGREVTIKVLPAPEEGKTLTIHNQRIESALDFLDKSIGSSNPMNVLRACLKALKSQNSPKLIAKIRGKKISEITKMKN